MTAIRPDLDVARIDGAEARTVRRWRMLGIVFVLALLLTAAGVVEWARGQRAGAAVESVLVGTWVLTGVDHNGQPAVTPGDLAPTRVTLKFDGRGTATVGSCPGTSADYRVRWHHVTFRNSFGGAVACGYLTPEAQRIGTTVDAAANAVVEHGAEAAFPAAGQMTLSVGDDVLRYTR